MNAIGRYLKAIEQFAAREPVRTFSILRSVGIVVIAFFPGLISPDQSAAIVALGVVWFGVDETIRHQTTPVVAPKVEVGTKITVVNPDPEVPDKTVIA